MNNQIDKFMEPISVAIALGANVGVIPGMLVYQAVASQGQYEDYHETSLGYFGDEVGAQNKALEWMFTKTEWIYDLSSKGVNSIVPWGVRPIHDFGLGDEALVAWNIARKDWFNNNSFEDILDWFNNSGVYIDEYATIEIFTHTVNFSQPINYITRGTWDKK